MTAPTGRRRNVALAAVLAIGFAVGVALVLLGGGSDSPDGATADTTTTVTSAPPRAPLPLEDTSQVAIEDLTGLSFPAASTEFLTAKLDNDSQLDVTFVIPSDAEVDFVRESGLPIPEVDQRVVIHSSPLWKLNPEDGATLRGTSDSTDDVNRAVELVDQPDGSVRARVVITSAR